MASFKLGALVERVTSTATAAGNTTLVNNSTTNQRFTGTTTQTVTMPDATTMVNGMKFVIQNRSTGVVTVNANGGGLLKSMSANTETTFTLYSNGTAAGTWDVSAGGGGGGSGGSGLASSSYVAINPSVDSPKNLVSGDSGKVFGVNSANGAQTFVLPSAVAGLVFSFDDVGGQADTNNITIQRAGSEQIMQVAANYVFAGAYGWFSLYCDGTNWIRVA